MSKKKIKYQINCLKYHLSEAIEEKEDAIERVKDIRKEIKILEEKLPQKELRR